MRTYILTKRVKVPVTNGNRGSREGVRLPTGHTCIANNSILNIIVFQKKDPNGNRPGWPSWVILSRN